MDTLNVPQEPCLHFRGPRATAASGDRGVFPVPYPFPPPPRRFRRETRAWHRLRSSIGCVPPSDSVDTRVANPRAGKYVPIKNQFFEILRQCIYK